MLKPHTERLKAVGAELTASYNELGLLGGKRQANPRNTQEGVAGKTRSMIFAACGLPKKVEYHQTQLRGTLVPEIYITLPNENEPITPVNSNEEKGLRIVTEDLIDLEKRNMQDILSDEEIEHSPNQKKWRDRIIKEEDFLLRAFGIRKKGLVDERHVHMVEHAKFNEIVGNTDDESEPQLINDGYCNAGHIVLDTSQKLWCYIHTLTHEIGHANNKRSYRILNVPNTPNAIMETFLEEIGLREQTRNNYGEIKGYFDALDEMINELIGFIKRLNIFTQYEEDLKADLSETEIQKLLMTFSCGEVGMRLTLGLIEHIAQVLEVSPIYVIAQAIKSQYSDNQEFFRMMHLALTPRLFELLAIANNQGGQRLWQMMTGIAQECGSTKFPNDNILKSQTGQQIIEFLRNRRAQHYLYQT